MRLVIDIECNSLINPTKIWCVVCKDIDTGEVYVFKNLHVDQREVERFKELAGKVQLWIGHNFLSYDYPVLCSIIHFCCDDIATRSIDTFIISKLFDYSREGHSIEDYGIEFGLEKGKFNDWSQLTDDMVDYCRRDMEICHRIFLKYFTDINNPKYRASIIREHKFQIISNSISSNGFYFNISKCERLLDKVTQELEVLDKEILRTFPPKLHLIKEIHPRLTRHGTLHKQDFRWVRSGDLTEFTPFPFCRCEFKSFNPSSHRQIVDVLAGACWKPIDKTATHIEATRQGIVRADLEKYGWKINETNLATLPDTAPKSARTLALRILYEARRRTLTEWKELYNPDTGRIHGKFISIGAWTHRMAHQKPNMANIPNEFDTQGKVKLLGADMRSCFCVPKGRLLVGVDAEGIQLRIFAHYIDDPEFTKALVEGRKDDKTDPHSLNQKILGSVCKSRSAAKRFIYALLLGAGLGKLAEVLGCSIDEAKLALERLLLRYEGFARLKRTVIPKDASRGYFYGLDGCKVKIPGATTSERRHLAMSGYLQNGEATIMKHATIRWLDKVEKKYEQRLSNIPSMVHLHSYLENTPNIGLLVRSEILVPKLVNLVHDEWQTEMPSNDMEEALWMAQTQSDSLREVGEILGLRCPLAGSYWNEDKKDYTIGTNWKVTH